MLSTRQMISVRLCHSFHRLLNIRRVVPVLGELDLAYFRIITIACSQIDLFWRLTRVQDHLDRVAIYRLGLAVSLRASWSVDCSIFLNTLFKVSREPFHVLIYVDLAANLFRTLTGNRRILVVKELVSDLDIGVAFRIIECLQFLQILNLVVYVDVVSARFIFR